LTSGKRGRQIVALPGFTSYSLRSFLVTLIPGGPTLPPIQQQRSHRAVAADHMFLELIKKVHGWMPDFGHVGRPSTYLAVTGSSRRATFTSIWSSGRTRPDHAS